VIIEVLFTWNVVDEDEYVWPVFMASFPQVVVRTTLPWSHRETSSVAGD